MEKICLLLIFIMIAPLSWAKDDNPYGKKEDLSPAQEYAMEKPATRAYGVGTAKRENLALQLAATNARTELAQKMEVAVLRASEGDDSAGEKVENDNKGDEFFDHLKSICQRVLRETHITKIDKYYNKENRKYTIIACLEYQGESRDLVKELVNELRNIIPLEDRSKFDSEQGILQEKIERWLSGQ